MIVYLDASALVKRYVSEKGSREVRALMEVAGSVGTALISRAETAAALAKASRMGLISREAAFAALGDFRLDWEDLVRVHLSEPLMARAEGLSWEHGLRGYDAVHLAAAAFWQEALDEPVALATFDKQLWAAAGEIGMTAWPRQLD